MPIQPERLWGPLEFNVAFEMFAKRLLTRGDHVDTGHWQSIKDVPQTKTVELRNEVLVTRIPFTQEGLAVMVKPNLPWAEDHFQERVSGKPLNPGVQYRNWPWYRGNVPAHQTVAPPGPDGGTYHYEGDKPVMDEPKFSHTYMERYWPKEVPLKSGHRHTGLRYPLGDLNDLVDLLVREPYTRQAYLPVWFPEDTGAVHGERVPCSLGYHFLLRGGRLHINYYIRSCDLLRHFRDDVYLTARLAQWVLDQANRRAQQAENMFWNQEQQPGELTMIMSSLHVFEGDLPKLRRDYG